jgi:hypothetical protein
MKTGNDDDELKNDEEVKDYISGLLGLNEGEGLEEAFRKWKELPKEQRTESELIHIIKSIAGNRF